jgi:hypothetical protein
MIKMGIPHLPEFSFALCGQPYAQWKLAKDISTSLANQESYNRLVFLLGGLPVMARQRLQKCYQGSLATMHQKGQGSIKLVGNFKFTVTPEVISFIADQYDEQQGITSLKDFIKDEIHDAINDEHFEKDNPENTQGPLEQSVGHFSLCGSEGDEEILFDWHTN